MTNRKKRLEKGITSLQKQVEIHEEKLKKAEEEGMEELVDYYNNEIEAKKRDIDKKKKLLEK